VLADLRGSSTIRQRDVNYANTFDFFAEAAGTRYNHGEQSSPAPKKTPRGEGGGLQSTIGAQNLRRPRGAWGVMRFCSWQSKQIETLKKGFPSMLAALPGQEQLRR